MVNESDVELVEQVPAIPTRDRDSHKGTYGRLLFVGGSRGMSGAISLSAIASLRAGAGLVTVATNASSLSTVASFDPCYMTLPLAEDRQGRIGLNALNEILWRAANANCVAIGPGFGRSWQLVRLVQELYQKLNVPMVIDADGLNALSQLPWGVAPAPRVLTPHPGEFERLIGLTNISRAEQIAAANRLAKEKRVTILLKGAGTWVTDGERGYRNSTGNPGMATGGSGDVLTGIIAAWIGQGYSSFDGAVLGAYLHGFAGDLAAEELGEVSLKATDLINFLPQAIKCKQSR